MAVSDSTAVAHQVQAKIPIERERLIEWCNEVLSSWGLEGDALIYIRTAILLIGVAVLSWGIWWLSRTILLQIVHMFAAKSKTKWDDYLVKNKVFSAFAHLVPLIFMDRFIQTIFFSFPKVAEFFMRFVVLAILFVVMVIINRFLNATRDVLEERPALKDKPIAAFTQLGKIILSGLIIISMVSVAAGIHIIDVLVSLGAATAVLLLIFKDTILGFVGSIQLAANDMIRIGDWVTMEKFGADGDVLEINLTTVKVQNFDKTITTIPTYSFISDSFRNWRGMQESDGRRLVRSINMKIESIKFCTPELLNNLGEIEIIRKYVEQKESEINDFNQSNEVNKTVLLNGRNQTNLGIFRHYMTEYLRNNPEINSSMTLMVRQLASTETGVPLQIYCFTNTHDWVKYEEILADIFDHLLASAKYFELEVFENPSGSDMRQMGK